MLRKVALTISLACAALPARAGPMDKALAKLAPEERSQQACVLKGLDTVRRDARLRRADRISASIFGPAVLDGTLLTAKGGAIRVADRWYALSFACHLTGDLMKATSFTFALGAEIPKESWDKLGLWG
jgi:Domain of Unknown Function (DUF930)